MGFVLYSDIDTFFSKYLYDNKDKSFSNYNIIVVSRDIITDEKCVDGEGYSTYKSKYKNIDFLLNLYPSPKVLEFYHGSSANVFAEAYIDQLKLDNNRIDICCILDMVINDDKNVILICSKNELLMEFFDILKDYINSEFGCNIYSMAEYYENKDCINNLGDMDDVKKLLLFHMKELGLIDDVTGVVVNYMMPDMIEKYREVLMKKSKDELFKIAASKGTYVNKHGTIESMVDHILKKYTDKYVGGK